MIYLEMISYKKYYNKLLMDNLINKNVKSLNYKNIY
jgi:hypothetical protein